MTSYTLLSVGAFQTQQMALALPLPFHTFYESIINVQYTTNLGTALCSINKLLNNLKLDYLTITVLILIVQGLRTFCSYV